MTTIPYKLATTTKLRIKAAIAELQIALASKSAGEFDLAMHTAIRGLQSAAPESVPAQPDKKG